MCTKQPYIIILPFKHIKLAKPSLASFNLHRCLACSYLCRKLTIAGIYLKSELVKLLRIPQAIDVCVKEAVLSKNEVCSLHGPKCPTEVAHIYGRMPAVKNLCKFLHVQPCLSTMSIPRYF